MLLLPCPIGLVKFVAHEVSLLLLAGLEVGPRLFRFALGFADHNHFVFDSDLYAVGDPAFFKDGLGK